ncbi:MAG: DUF4468 domain-containing protein [Hymenobacter sp.]|nr:MAG: DUF4468 domain-containing protein [Hymenobacter sp.]
MPRAGPWPRRAQGGLVPGGTVLAACVSWLPFVSFLPSRLMKRLPPLLLLLGLGLSAQAQAPSSQSTKPGLPVDSASGKILYEGVVQAPGASQAELYRRARNWFVGRFPDYQRVVSVEDQAGGQLAATYCTLLQKLTNSYEVWRTLRVYVKDGRYRYEITDFGGRDIGNRYDPQIYRVEPTNPMNVRRYGPEVARQAQADIASLTAAMAISARTTASGKEW